MGKISAFKLKEVVYTLSPFEVKVMKSLWSEFTLKTEKRIKENWVSFLTVTVPVVGTYAYAEKYVEEDKLHHRM